MSAVTKTLRSHKTQRRRDKSVKPKPVAVYGQYLSAIQKDVTKPNVKLTKRKAARLSAISTTLKSHMAEKICDAIMSGDFQPGDRLTETQLSEQFAVSRVPIREALFQLKEYGLVMKHKRRGLCVTKLSSEEVQRINAVRAVLEVEAIWLARNNMTSTIAAKLKQIIKRMADIADPLTDSPALDLEFHSTIWNASGNSYLVRTLTLLVLQLFVYKSLEYKFFSESASQNMRKDRRDWRLAHHSDLLDVVLGKSNVEPEVAILAHISAGFDNPERFASFGSRKKRVIE